MSTSTQDADPLSVLRRRLAHVTNLPTLPSVALQIVELARDPDVGLAEVADLIALDPALAGKVLRLANSPVYSRQRRIDNIRQALVLFGLDGALTVALSFSVARLVEEDRRASGLDYVHFWRRSLSTAAAAPMLAVRKTGARKEDLFLAGLIQDIGMLALDLVDSGLYMDIGADQYDHERLIGRERERLGAHHGDATVWLLERWNFPQSVIDAVASSHRPADALAREGSLEARILHVAAILADAWWQEDRQQAIGRFAREAQRLLGLGEETILELFEEFTPEILRLSGILEADLGDPVLLAAVADEARELLMLRNLQSLQQTQEMEQKAQRLEEKASTDPLTGAGNRGFFDEVLATEFDTARRHGWPLSLLLADLDHFQRINDTHGHQAGDRVLQETVRRMEACLRRSDTLARYGGEEFAIILPGTQEAGAGIVADRILEALRASPVTLGEGVSVPVTASIGLVTMQGAAPFETPTDLLRAADRALYEAKGRGRDCAVFYSSLER